MGLKPVLTHGQSKYKLKMVARTVRRAKYKLTKPDWLVRRR